MGDPVWIVCQLSLTGGIPMNISFLNQFSENIKFKYFCFNRVIIRGYILFLFFPAGVVRLLRALGFKGLSNGVMRILTDLPAVLKAQLLQAGQLNAHIQKIARNNDILIHWWLPALPAPYDER